MISTALSKRIRSLSLKKYRDRYGQYMAEGDKIVLELIQAGPEVKERILQIAGTAEWIDDHQTELRGVERVLIETGQKEIDRVSNLVTPPPVLALMKKADHPYEPGLLCGGPVLIFEAIRDPGNLGSALRTAEWFGVNHVVCSPDSVDIYNPKVVQAAMGTVERIRVHYRDPGSLMAQKEYSDKTIYGTYPDGPSIYREPLDRDCFVLFGSESHGLPGRYKGLIGKRISIPSSSADRNGPESLNLSAAVAVVCSELRRADL